MWIVLRLDISVTSTIGIGDLRLRAHWFAGEAALVKPCPEHPESYCLSLNPGGQHWSFSSDQVLNRWNRTKGILPRGAHCKGYILARVADFLATSRAEYLDIEICIDDWLGNEMFPCVDGEPSSARLTRRALTRQWAEQQDRSHR